MHPTFITGNDLYLPLLVKILFCAMRTGDGDASPVIRPISAGKDYLKRKPESY